jgi:acyl-coenzyme A thioesterase PaaI-like protein
LGLVHQASNTENAPAGKGLLWRNFLLSIDLRRRHALGAFAHRGWIGFKGLNTSNKGQNRVDNLTNTAFLRRPDLHVETQGEFAGWRTWSRDSFKSNNGPFWHKMDEDGRVRCAFRVEQKHLNGLRNVHGGGFMTFADYCLFAFASPVLQGPGVTVSFACEFLDAAHEGDLIEATGEITRAGGSLIFLRGMLSCGERKLFSFSGTIKRVKMRPPAPPK